jgi:hypothetical protein
MLRTVYGLAEPRREAAKQQTQHVSAEVLGLHVLGDLPIYQRFHVEGTCRDATPAGISCAAWRSDRCSFERKPARPAPRI